MYTLSITQAQATVKEAAVYFGCSQADIMHLLIRGERVPLPTGALMQLTAIKDSVGKVTKRIIQLTSLSIDGLDVLPYTQENYKDPYAVFVDDTEIKTFHMFKPALDFVTFITDYFDAPKQVKLIETKSGNTLAVWHRVGPGEWSAINKKG